MQLTSPVFKHGETIPMIYTCEGPNINPPLQIKDVPAEAETLVLMIEDPDADAKPWVHWLVYNIPAAATTFPENGIPEGAVQGICNGNTYGYEGPCPPLNQHTYLFKLYAVDIRLNVPLSANRKMILKAMQGHVVAECELTGVYQKHKQTAEV